MTQPRHERHSPPGNPPPPPPTPTDKTPAAPRPPKQVRVTERHRQGPLPRHHRQGVPPGGHDDRMAVARAQDVDQKDGQDALRSGGPRS